MFSQVRLELLLRQLAHCVFNLHFHKFSPKLREVLRTQLLLIMCLGVKLADQVFDLEFEELILLLKPRFAMQLKINLIKLFMAHAFFVI